MEFLFFVGDLVFVAHVALQIFILGDMFYNQFASVTNLCIVKIDCEVSNFTRVEVAFTKCQRATAILLGHTDSLVKTQFQVVARISNRWLRS